MADNNDGQHLTPVTGSNIEPVPVEFKNKDILR